MMIKTNAKPLHVGRGNFAVHSGGAPSDMGEFRAMNDNEIELITQIYLKEGKETTHSEDCWKWHSSCAISKILKALIIYRENKQ